LFIAAYRYYWIIVRSRESGEEDFYSSICVV
jgi:hypothetical protein